MFIQAHDPNYVPEPIYPEYIPLEDDHEFPAEEQPLPPVDLPTVESPRYVTESDLEEDPEGDDANDEDEDKEDEEDEEEEEHLAPADSTTVIPVDEPVFPPEGTEPVIPPPSTDITIGARITVDPCHPIPSTSWQRSLTAPPAHSPPLPPSSGCLTQNQALRIASTQALIDAVTTALPPPPLPPLPPSLYIPPPVDRRDDIPESEQPPRKRLHLSTLGSRYEIGESSTARPTRGQGIDYGFVSTVDTEERRQGIRDVGYGIRDTWVDPAEAVPEIAPMTMGEANTRVVELAEPHKRDTQDLYALLEDAQDGRSRISQRVDMNSQRVDLLMGDRMTLQETVWMVEEEAYASREAWARRSKANQALIRSFRPIQTELAALRETDRRRQDQMVETLRVIRDMRREMSDMQAELLALREQQRRARQPGPEARIPDHQEASGDADRAEGVVGLTRWIEKMESVFHIMVMPCLKPSKVCRARRKNKQVRPQAIIKKLRYELWNLKVKGNDVPAYTKRTVKGSLDWGSLPSATRPSPPQCPCNQGNCPKLKNKMEENRNAQVWVYAVGNAEIRGGYATGNPDMRMRHSQSTWPQDPGLLAQYPPERIRQVRKKQIRTTIVRDLPEVVSSRNCPVSSSSSTDEIPIDLVSQELHTVARAPYRLTPSEMKELSEQLQELSDKVRDQDIPKRHSELGMALTSSRLCHSTEPNSPAVLLVTIEGSSNGFFEDSNSIRNFLRKESSSIREKKERKLLPVDKAEAVQLPNTGST
ncbi:hypothetical protein Tco_1262927 [Tanacetum coccineum]